MEKAKRIVMYDKQVVIFSRLTRVVNTYEMLKIISLRKINKPHLCLLVRVKRY